MFAKFESDPSFRFCMIVLTARICGRADSETCFADIIISFLCYVIVNMWGNIFTYQRSTNLFELNLCSQKETAKLTIIINVWNVAISSALNIWFLLQQKMHWSKLERPCAFFIVADFCISSNRRHPGFPLSCAAEVAPASLLSALRSVCLLGQVS